MSAGHAREVRGSTALVGVAGDPIAHSRSPQLHNAAFAALGIDAVSVALQAGIDDAASVADAIRHLGFVGLSVTMPLKAAIVEHCDSGSEVVDRLGAANCLVRADHGAVRAESTDGDGLLAAIECVAGADVDGARCAVLGAGGAARAAIDALVHRGASDVAVIARRTEAAEQAAAPYAVARAAPPDAALDAALVVQATPVGMQGAESASSPALLDGALLGEGQLAVELVYHPRVTTWLARAAQHGAATVDGAEVLVHQASLALELWFGQPMPLDALHAAMDAP